MDIRALWKISYGMYIVGSKSGDKHNAQIANTVFQVTSEPPAIAASISKRNLTHGYIQESRVFTVSILSKEMPMKLIGQFGFKSGRDTDKFAGVGYKQGLTGARIVTENCIGFLEAELTDSVDAGTHTIFIGRVVNSGVSGENEPMTYMFYHEVKKGLAPRNAPTYMEPGAEKKEAVEMDKYRCTVCGYIYEPDKGDPDSGIKAGTAFEALPDTWACPVCGAKKSEFEKI